MAVCHWMKAVILRALYLEGSVIAEEIIWIMQNILQEGHGQKMRRKKTKTLCGICGAEENHRCQAEISRLLSGLVKDETTWHEESNPYYRFYEEEKVCNMILHEFGLYSERSHIINGHTPVRTSKGEHPVRANGRLMVIDGGFCKSYHKTTGIAGYTLIFNSHGIRIKSHQPFQSVFAALTENLLKESRLGDLQRAVKDEAFRSQLFEEYNIKSR